jgi:hypothetical protein
LSAFVDTRYLVAFTVTHTGWYAGSVTVPRPSPVAAVLCAITGSARPALMSKKATCPTSAQRADDLLSEIIGALSFWVLLLGL